KVDYRALPDPQAAGARPGDDGTAPRTPLERQIAAIIQQVLGAGDVGAHDDFFELGGDSVSAVAVVGALRDDGVDVWVRDVFEFSTIAELAEALAPRPAISGQTHRVAPFELISADDRAKVPPGVVDAYPLSMLQRGMLYEMLCGSEV